jgi:hypothetical protein
MGRDDEKNTKSVTTVGVPAYDGTNDYEANPAPEKQQGLHRGLKPRHVSVSERVTSLMIAYCDWGSYWYWVVYWDWNGFVEGRAIRAVVGV